MAEVAFAPFRALRYQPVNVGALGDVWAPPYDVIGPEEAQRLRGRSEYNIVHVTNPTGDDEARYERAGARLRAWIADSILEQHPLPAFYLHQHRFTRQGEAFVRTGVWGRLKLEALDAGVVLPHERTMPGPKADRLALMRACRAQLSPVFMICSDPDGAVARLLREQAAAEATETAEFPEGETHRVWRVDDGGSMEELAERIHGQVLLIADGHHRYETALALRDGLIADGARATGLRTHEYVMVYIVPEGDPGLLLLPTHRAIQAGDLDWHGALERAEERFEVRPIDEGELAAAETLLATDAGGPTFVVVLPDEPGGWLLTDRSPDAFGAFASVALHEVFLPRYLGLAPEDQPEGTRYFPDPEDALALVRSGAAGAAALLAAPAVAQVRHAAQAGVRLPPKTTYFTPKVPTGVALHPIDPTEEVELPGD